MATITPFLWFDKNAEEAAEFYLSTFPQSRKVAELRSTSAGPWPQGTIGTITIELLGQTMTFLNGGPGHPHTVAFSLVVHCKDQAEIDHYWTKLTEGGREVQCGWLVDRFGVSWQVVPQNIAKLVSNPKGMQAMMGMKKFDIAVLEAAAKS